MRCLKSSAVSDEPSVVITEHPKGCSLQFHLIQVALQPTRLGKGQPSFQDIKIEYKEDFMDLLDLSDIYASFE